MQRQSSLGMGSAVVAKLKESSYMQTMGGRRTMMLLSRQVCYSPSPVVALPHEVVQGTDFNGKIVIARYGGNFRGLKVR